MSNKIREVKLGLDPNIKKVKNGNLTVWSHDKNSFEIKIYLDDGCGNPLVLTDGKLRIMLIPENSPIQIFDLNTDSDRLGEASFIIPVRLLGFVGDVKATVYVDYDDKTHDLGSFNFNMKRSDIDKNMPELTFYVEEFEKAVESMKDAENQFGEASEKLEGKVSEIEKKIEENDIVTQPEMNEHTKEAVIPFKNKWLSDLNGQYIAHKGFTGIKFDGPVKEGLYPDNTIKSFEAAGELGYKAIETDLVRCKDGFIISHEEDTTLLDGEIKNYKDMTVAEIKRRNINKQYIGGGTYNTLTGANANYKVPTFKETLDICKKYNMYIILDVRFMTGYTYSQKDIDELVSIVRDSGMEKFCIWYGNSNYKICDILKDSILAVATINENNVESAIDYIKRYNNYTFSVGEANYLKYMKYAKEYEIPLMVWTIDEYYKADDIFLNGANCILTNRLIKNVTSNSLNMLPVNVDISFRQNGQGTYLFEDETHKFDSTTYLSQYYYIPKNMLKKGDIVRVKATGRTLRSSSPIAFGRIIIDNSLSGNKYIRSLSFFKTDSFEEKEVYFVVSDVTEDISINLGMAGGTFSGNGSCEIKNVSVDVFSNVDFSENAYGLIYCYNGTIALRPGFSSNGIKSVKKSGTDSSIIEIEYDLKRLHKLKPVVMSSLDAYSNQYMYKIIPQNVDITLGVLKVKFLDADNKIVPDVDKLQLAFSIQIM